MDDVCWRAGDGRHYACGCNVPSMAGFHEDGSVVYQCWGTRIDRAAIRNRNCAVDILHHHRGGGKPWNLDIPEPIRRRWIRAYRLRLST